MRHTTPHQGSLTPEDLVTIPVTYDGEDLHEAAQLLDCEDTELVRRHTAEEWVVAFCGFAPGFGYLTSTGWGNDVPAPIVTAQDGARRIRSPGRRIHRRSTRASHPAAGS